MTDKKIRTDYPLDYHPDAIVGDTLGSSTGRRALSYLIDAHERIVSVAGQVHDKTRLATKAQSVAEAAIGRADSDLGRLRTLQKHLEDELEAAVVKPQMPNERSDIRAYWRGQQHAAKDLHQIIAAGDVATMSAVLSGPAYLSGLKDEEQALLRDRAMRAVAPEQHRHLGETRTAIERLDRALGNFTKSMAENIRSWRNDDNELLERL